MTDVLYTCSFVPPEWIEAHGLRPVRVLPATDGDVWGLPETGVCPFARSYAAEVLAAGDRAAAVFTTRCDQMRRLFDLVSARRSGPTFLLNVPATWRTSAAEMLYAGELRRMGNWMRSIGGAAPQIEPPVVLLPAEVEPPGPVRHQVLTEGEPVRLAVTGGPLPNECTLAGEVRAAGGEIVLDATENAAELRAGRCECRHVAAQAPGACEADEVVESLAHDYLRTPSVHQRPSNQWLCWLRGALLRDRVEGVIIRRYVWCDLWHAQVRTLADEIGLPVLDLEVANDADAARARTATRIGGFVEMVRAARLSGERRNCRALS